MPTTVLLYMPHQPPPGFLLAECDVCSTPGWVGPTALHMGVTRFCEQCYELYLTRKATCGR